MKTLNFTTMIAQIAASDASSFYRDQWGSARDYDSLPRIDRSHFAAVPLRKRRYCETSGLVKVVRTDGAFLSEWSFESIAAQAFGTHSKRPMAHFSDPYESLEKAVWCREHGMLAVVGERTLEATRYIAQEYDIDALIGDETALAELLPVLASRAEPLVSTTIVSASFTPDAFQKFARAAREVRLVLALPEAGAIAEARYGDSTRFIPFPHVHAEVIDGMLVITQLLDLVTPIVKYDTRIPAHMESGEIVIAPQPL